MRHYSNRKALPLQHRSDVPRDKLIVPKTEKFAFGSLPGRGFEHRPENNLTHFLDGGLSIQNKATVHVHVLLKPLLHVGIGGQFDGGHGLKAANCPSPCGETDHIGTACHHACYGRSVVTRRVHEYQTLV